MKKIFLALILNSSFGLAATPIESFFKNIEGKWQGELIELEVNTIHPDQPWKLVEGHLKIVRDFAEDYHFELSSNASALDNDNVYFLKLTDLKTKKSEIYTLSQGTDQQIGFSFWSHITGTTTSGSNYVTAKGIKLFSDKAILTIGFISGNSYCQKNDSTEKCGSDGYGPYELKRTK